jgi:hypothetical protein
MCHWAVARLSCTPMSVGASRAFVAKHLAAWGVDADDSAAGRVDDMTLVISELAGNATKFCSKEIEISLVAHRDHVEVAGLVAEFEAMNEGGQGQTLLFLERWGARRIKLRATAERLRTPAAQTIIRTAVSHGLAIDKIPENSKQASGN